MAGILGVGEPLVANYPINLVHVARLSKEERVRLKSDFRLVAESIAEKDEREFLHFLRGNNQSIRHGEELMEVITELTGNPGYREQYEKVKKKAQEEKEGEVKMIDFGAIFEERGLQQAVKYRFANLLPVLQKETTENPKKNHRCSFGSSAGYQMRPANGLVSEFAVPITSLKLKTERQHRSLFPCFRRQDQRVRVIGNNVAAAGGESFQTSDYRVTEAVGAVMHRDYDPRVQGGNNGVSLIGVDRVIAADRNQKRIHGL